MMLAERKFHMPRLKGVRPAMSNSNTCAKIGFKAELNEMIM